MNINLQSHAQQLHCRSTIGMGSNVYKSQSAQLYLNLGGHWEGILNSPMCREDSCCRCCSPQIKALHALPSLCNKLFDVAVTGTHDKNADQPSVQEVVHPLKEGLQSTAPFFTASCQALLSIACMTKMRISHACKELSTRCKKLCK